MLTKHAAVLHKQVSSSRGVMFKNGVPGYYTTEQRKNWEQYYMPREAWDDMGKPDVITISIEPGDTLNEED